MPLLLAAITRHHTLSIVMAAGLVTIFVFLAILIWTRWGQARPISKCIVLSILAHLLLLIYACSTQIMYGPPGSWTGQTVMMRLHDASDDEEAGLEASRNPTPWQQRGLTDVPLQQAPPLEKAPEELHPEQTAEKELPKSAEPSPAETSTADAAAPTPPPPPATPAPEAQPREVANEVAAPKIDAPALTDLLPENDQPSPKPEIAAAAPPTEIPSQQPITTSLPGPANQLPPSDSATHNQSPFHTATTSRPAVPRRLGDGLDLPETLRARVAADRLKAAQPFGASPQTEAAVAAALDWLAVAQSPDGRWDADAHGAGRETQTLGHNRGGAGAKADTGVSGLALLAFLGAGETHLEGAHHASVQRGLEFLLGSQSRNGNLSGNAEMYAAMYCHSIATLALSEAYALTGDDRLLPVLKKALRYTIDAQHPGGGWRYQPYDQGDMSQFGWQLMALHSAELGGIPIPTATRERMATFLQSCSAGRARGLAGYRPGDRASRSMTAEALACRYFLDAENAPATLDEAAAFVSQELPGTAATNFYYWYYGTLALFQRQGDDWQRWNSALQYQLLGRQRWDAPHTGSWDPDDLWGGYGGRVYSTSIATLSLEVYYRYLPIHGRGSSDTRLTDRPGLPPLPR
jgi:hypothetical protein